MLFHSEVWKRKSVVALDYWYSVRSYHIPPPLVFNKSERNKITTSMKHEITIIS